MTELLDSLRYDRWAIQALLLIPFAGALVVALAPARFAKGLALAVSLIEFIVSLGLWISYDPAGPPMQFMGVEPWIPAWGISYRVGIDGISLMMVLLTTFLMPLSVLGSWAGITTRQRGFYAMLLALTTGMIGVFVALDLFFFYVMWEVMLIPMYFIIGIWGGQRRLYAAIKFFIYTMAGSLLMLVAILYLYFAAGQASGGQHSFALDHIMRFALVGGKPAAWLFVAFFLAFAIKVPMVPFHTWLPDAHVEAPTAGSVILAGVLLKMGTYGFIRFAVPLFPHVAFSPTTVNVVVTLSLIGIIYGALVAMVQPDLKKLVAYSSVSHLGFVMLGIWALNEQSTQGAMMVMINHGISTGALFFLVGMIYERRHSRMIEDFGGIARTVPLFSAVLTIVALSSIGLPATNGFVGEFLVLVGSFRAYPWATALATTAVIAAAAYLLWALKRMLYGNITKQENRELTDLTGREYAVMVPLLVMIVWLGLYPKPVLERMGPSVRSYLETVQERRAGPEQVVTPPTE
ncbi:MAG TPA: NADH-quinone oxidoreductase subunit M [Gemmatimonadales bacterium]|nr:NADH-quinone oxidoreductase subunit M [Gemmatimonadales bacterium]